jgi:hypothetical protein
MHCAPHPSLARLLAKVFCLEEVEPHILLWLHPQVSLADRRENGSLRDGIRGKMVQLHLVVVEEHPHEVVGQHSEPLSWKATKLTT